MAPSARTQEARSDATRSALIAAARARFGAVGYDATSIGDLAAAASVTRGALYHHFVNKRALFEGAARQVAEELAQAGGTAATQASGDPWARTMEGFQGYLQVVAASPEIQRILLVDGPAVLGAQGWRDLQAQVLLPKTVAYLESLKAAGKLRRGEPEPLARLLTAALNDAALTIADAKDTERTRRLVTDALAALIEGFAERGG